MVGDVETGSMRKIRRWLKGEIVSGMTGIRLVDGPHAGRVRIVVLDPEGQPPPGTRIGTFGGDTWNAYVLSIEPGEGLAHPWVYRYAGVQPATTAFPDRSRPLGSGPRPAPDA
jgi:hypothetical protein